MKNTRILLLIAPFLLSAVGAAPAAPHKAKAHKPIPTISADRAVPKPALGAPFRDVPPGHWAASAVETLRQAGVVRGYPKGAGRTQER